jgi:hypothetical protein
VRTFWIILGWFCVYVVVNCLTDIAASEGKTAAEGLPFAAGTVNIPAEGENLAASPGKFPAAARKVATAAVKMTASRKTRPLLPRPLGNPDFSICHAPAITSPFEGRFNFKPKTDSLATG